jgi:hypothetical protein
MQAGKRAKADHPDIPTSLKNPATAWEETIAQMKQKITTSP